MIDYYFFYVYLIVFLSCPIIAARGLWRRNPDALAVALLVFFLAFIGLSTNWAGWMRVVSGMYGVMWSE